MTAQIPTQPSTSRPAAEPGAPGGAPYPDIADTAHAAAAAAAFFGSLFTAKIRRDIEATHGHFHPGKTVYFDATLGWALPDNAEVRAMWEQYMPGWPAGARSYPTQILGDMTSAVVFTTDTPELFGGEIRTISIADLEDGTIVRLVDYWDGRGFGAGLAASLRVPAESYPHDLGASTVTSPLPPVAAAGWGTWAGQAAGARQPEAGPPRPGHASGAAPPSRSAAMTWAACHGHGPGHCRGSVTRKAPGAPVALLGCLRGSRNMRDASSPRQPRRSGRRTARPRTLAHGG